MIPFTQRHASRRMGSTLVSYSRQSLPRPARLYSTPTKRVNAPSLAQAPIPTTDYPAYMPGTSSSDSSASNLEDFLRRRQAYTILPTPLPDDTHSDLNDLYFTDSPTQDHLSVMDACLHNRYDVPRAMNIFERLRKQKNAETVLSTKIYNSFMEVYIQLATDAEDPKRRSDWLAEAWTLFDVMEKGVEKIRPDMNSYAFALLAWQRFSKTPDPAVSQPANVHDPGSLLRSMIDNEISVPLVVADRAFSTSEEASEAIKTLSIAAAEMGLSSVVNELGMADSLGRQGPDVLQDIPEAIPVARLSKKTPGEQAEAASEDAAAEAPHEEVPFNLSALRTHLAQMVLARRVLSEDTAARQKLLENSVYDVAVARLKHQAELMDQLGLGKKGSNDIDLRKWMWDWHQKLQVKLTEEIQKIVEEEKSSKKANRQSLGAFLTVLKPEKLSLITILELMHLHGSGGVTDGMKTARALISVGRAVELEYKANMCKKNNIAVPSNNSNRAGEASFFSNLGYRDLHARRIAARKYMEDAEEWTADWTQAIRVRVGSFLVDCLMDVAYVTRTGVDRKTGKTVSEDQPAFFHSYEYLRGHKLGVIKLNPVVGDRLAKDAVQETLHPRHLPMLVQPKPWLSQDEGGYFFNKTTVMRFKESQEQMSYLRHACALGNMEHIFAGLDILGSTPWKINRAVFDVVLKVWNTGERMCKIPPSVYDAPEPDKPENYETDQRARMVYLERQKRYMSDKMNNHSDRCNVNYKIEIARSFLGDTFYQPHNLDFRGRAYPIPPHLNHMGDDLSRGLLVFAEAKPLGERGLRWLKIHLANLYGYDKASFDDRLQWAEDHLKEVFESAENPLDGSRWWLKADDPWQCLATCFELRAALTSENPLEYKSSLPVHQDGTCNGLQHYAALGGDARGAAQVNLDVSDKPSDVYTHVAQMVEDSIARDAEKGNEWAIELKGKIGRKVVKQTVMTTVYGVTFVGARDQIEKQLADRGDIPIEKCWLAASYIAKKVLSSIGDLFTGAKDIQNWLNLCARLISKSIPPERAEAALTWTPARKGSGGRSTSRLKKEQMTAVIWTTPIGLPIVQPYRATKRKQIHTHLQTVYISDPAIPTNVDSAKQASAFPPNFIHSLDATHMLLTALQCRERGLTFASVHDSYWTHAGDIDEMSALIRETFVTLHSSEVLQKLHEEFVQRYRDYVVPLSSLRSGQLINQITAAGSPIVHKTLKFDETSEEEGTIYREEEREAAAEVSEETAEEVSEDHHLEDDDAPAPVRTKPGRRRSTAAVSLTERKLIESAIGGDYVKLVDLLPPVPSKGTFDVKTVGKSLYFFS